MNIVIILIFLFLFWKMDIAIIALLLFYSGKVEIALILLPFPLSGKFSLALLVLFLRVCSNFFRKNGVKIVDSDSTCSDTESESDYDSSDTESSKEYEVFLSFHGEDTRKGFTDVLYTFLRVAGICTFRDNEDLHVGENISPGLVDAIKQSKISIPIFSKNYALSKWCMLELFQMVQMAKCEDCKKEKKANGGGEINIDINMAKCKNCNKRHKIIPIFYDVTPHDVKLKTEIYMKAFSQHMKNFDLETVQQWKAALINVGGLKGLELKKETNGYEGKLAKKIVKKVLQKLKKSYVQLPNILVGMEYEKEKLEEFLNPAHRCVRIVGIHGMGGIGKTTIAKFMYNELCESFEFCCFLENVRENSKDPNNLLKLQKQLITVLARGSYSDIVKVEEGRERIKDVIKGKKLLIVLDDVDEISQYFDIFDVNSNLFASGSRIIVTTRNKQVLNILKVTFEEENQHEVYRSYEPPLMNSDQSLKLFSNYAFKKDLPPEDYVALSRKIVSTTAGLPLALVSIGGSMRGNQVKDSWIAKLAEIVKNPHAVVLGNFGRSFDDLNDREQHIFLDIACLFIGEDCMIPSYMWEDCKLNPLNEVNANVLRSLIKIKDDSSLWMHDQLRDFGRHIVRAENKDLAGERSRLWQREEALDIFDRRMGTKKVLALCLDLIREENESRPDRLVRKDFKKLGNLLLLRLGSTDLDGDFKLLFSNLRWLQWKPLGNLSPTNCGLKNLVILDLSGSEIIDDWEGWSQIKRSTKLKVLNLCGCDKLNRAPDFSAFESLERLILGYCLSLGEIEPSMDEIEPSIGNLINLRVLDLSHCVVLSGILDCYRFVKLECLDLHSCLQLHGLYGFESLVALRYLNTSGCHNLRTLPNLSHLRELKKLSISQCNRLVEIQGLDRLDSLEYLDISGCVNIVNLPDMSNMKLLKAIMLSGCIKLASVNGIWKLKSLETMDLSYCTSQEHIPDLSNLKNLKKLKLDGFENFTEIHGLEELTSLELLSISGWKSIQYLPEFSNLKKLRVINTSYCLSLTAIWGFEELEFLEYLNINGCESIETLPDLSKLKRLKEIKAHRCVRLSTIQGLEELESLELVVIAGCISLEPLPHLPNTTIDEF